MCHHVCGMGLDSLVKPAKCEWFAVSAWGSSMYSRAATVGNICFCAFELDGRMIRVSACSREPRGEVQIATCGKRATLKMGATLRTS